MPATATVPQLSLLLGIEAVPGVRRGRDADHVGPGPPKIGEREVVAALLDHNHDLIRTGQVLLADKGFAGREFHQHVTGLGLRLLGPDRKDETYRNGNLGSVRQWIESVNQTLKDRLDLEKHGTESDAPIRPRWLRARFVGHIELNWRHRVPPLFRDVKQCRYRSKVPSTGKHVETSPYQCGPVDQPHQAEPQHRPAETRRQ